MTDLMPKLTDVKSLQDLSKILAWPMLVVAYFLATGPQIGFDGDLLLDIPDGLPMSTQTWLFFFIFILKALWSGGIAAFVYILIGELHFEAYIRWNLLIFPYISAFLFALALLGIFGSSRFVWLRNLNSFWCYAAIVWGFFLLAMTEQLVEPLKRRTERATA
ncbi:hypothetical protein [Caballeronia sp. LZ034LL]|uniref:hypothetical protein n=1 Tax=Caballeronia sp. LZ034LL TaxID=3038567 RepID=UPI00286385A6|nr:hypothetical protein [Caballeronia sp. LZ034LL]MDR5838785.1 hypothetical protein [Caballeronia sp. LZ034LL]